jgi:Leucine-rich repeat (LRR) protein
LARQKQDHEARGRVSLITVTFIDASAVRISTVSDASKSLRCNLTVSEKWKILKHWRIWRNCTSVTMVLSGWRILSITFVTSIDYRWQCHRANVRTIGQTKLTTLDVGNNSIPEIENLSHLRHLTELWVRIYLKMISS